MKTILLKLLEENIGEYFLQTVVSEICYDIGHCYELCAPSPNSYVEALIPNTSGSLYLKI